MPIAYIGATIEVRCVPMWSLAAIAVEVQKEMERRAWAYIRVIGYRPYRETTMDVSVSKRNEIQIVTIACDFEENHEHKSVSIDVPYKLFETAVPHHAVET